MNADIAKMIPDDNRMNGYVDNMAEMCYGFYSRTHAEKYGYFNAIKIQTDPDLQDKVELVPVTLMSRDWWGARFHNYADTIFMGYVQRVFKDEYTYPNPQLFNCLDTLKSELISKITYSYQYKQLGYYVAYMLYRSLSDIPKCEDIPIDIIEQHYKYW